MDDQKITDAVMLILIQPEILALPQDDQDDLVAAILSIIVSFYQEITGTKTAEREILKKLDFLLKSQKFARASESATCVNYYGNA